MMGVCPCFGAEIFNIDDSDLDLSDSNQIICAYPGNTIFETGKIYELINNCRKTYYGDNDKENFNNLWEVLKKELHKFGRYSTWFYMQQLKHTADVKIEPTSLLLNDYSGSRSHRNGFLYAIGEEDKVDSKLTSAEYDRLESIGTGILNEMRVDYPHIKKDLDYFAMETALCSFKKLFRTSRGRYLGYYLDRQAEEIMKVEKDGWHGIEWNVLWEARNETLDLTLSNKCGIIKEKYTSFLDTGKLDKLEMMYKDEVKMNIGLEAFF